MSKPLSLMDQIAKNKVRVAAWPDPLKAEARRFMGRIQNMSAAVTPARKP